MTRNELKTMAAVAYGQAAVQKVGAYPKMREAVHNAFDIWRCERSSLTHQNIKQSSKWLEEFERALWKGEEQEAHTHLSFAIAILERQSGFLKGRKLKVIDYMVKVMLQIYNDLPASLHSEDFCNDLASRAVEIWEEVIDAK